MIEVRNKSDVPINVEGVRIKPRSSSYFNIEVNSNLLNLQSKGIITVSEVINNFNTKANPETVIKRSENTENSNPKLMDIEEEKDVDTSQDNDLKNEDIVKPKRTSKRGRKKKKSTTSNK